MSDSSPPARRRPDASEALGAAFVAGDAVAFSQVVEEHLDTLYTFCLRMLDNEAEADDVAQEALLRAYLRRDLFRVGAPLRPWLLTIAANLCRSRLRSIWWRRVLPLSGREFPSDHPEILTVERDRDGKVRRALRGVPTHYREVLSLYYFDDMSYDEMSRVTGLKVPALKQRVRRGIGMLEKSLDRLYPDLELGRTQNEDSQ